MASESPGSEHEQDQERDREAEQAGRFGEGEAEERERRHLRRRVAGERVDQRREHVADADTGADKGDAGKAGTDHFGGSEIHEYPLGLSGWKISEGGWRRGDRGRSGW